MQFSDIFETRNPVTDEEKQAALTDGFSAVQTNSSGGKVEYLKVKEGMEQAAAFLESRRYGAILGATSEFNKMEAVDYNKKDNKLYLAMSYIEKAMEDRGEDYVNDIKVDKLSAGAVYEITLDSNYNATYMDALVIGEDLSVPDAAGNEANPDKIANPDNIAYAEDLRTLFISEDSGMHSNNFAWAYNIDTKKLSRIASVPGGGEATGLQYIENLNGFSYLMLSSQNPSHIGYLQLPETNAPAAPQVNAVSDSDTKVTGTAEANANVTVTSGGKVLGSTTAGGNGAFSVTIARQKAGTPLTVYAEDAYLNKSETVQLTVADKTAPAKPAVNPVSSDDTNVNGTAEAGSKVSVASGEKVLGSTTADADGKFSISVEKQKAGSKLFVYAEDAAGNKSEAASVTVAQAKDDQDDQNGAGNDQQGNGNNGNNGNGQNTNDQNADNQQPGSRLPDTATSMFNWLLTGVALIVTGAAASVALWFRKRRLTHTK